MSKAQSTGTDVEALVGMLASRNGLTRQKARKSLVAMGTPAVPCLAHALQQSSSKHVRWEAAKALGAISNASTIPVLVEALEDSDADVAWLAAEALRKFRKAAWPALLQRLLKKGAVSEALIQGAHHVFGKQKEDGFNDVQEALVKALGSSEGSEAIPLAAYDFIRRMTETPL